jgi:hypothetical protein
MEPFAALDRARVEVEWRLDAVGPDQWSLPTPCTEWTVYTSMAPMAPFISRLGMFGSGPSGEVDKSAPPQVRLLDLSGRRS